MWLLMHHDICNCRFVASRLYFVILDNFFFGVSWQPAPMLDFGLLHECSVCHAAETLDLLQLPGVSISLGFQLTSHQSKC